MINKTFEYNDKTYEVFDALYKENACDKCCLKDNICKEDIKFYCSDFMDKHEYAEEWKPTPKYVDCPSDKTIRQIVDNTLGFLFDKHIVSLDDSEFIRDYIDDICKFVKENIIKENEEENTKKA